MSNSDLFNFYAASVLGELYESFPIPIDLSNQKLAENSPPFDAENAPAVAESTLRWLEEHGYFYGVNASSMSGYRCLQARLTEKGLAALGREIDVSNETVGSKLRKLGKETSREAGRAALNDFVHQLFALGARMIGN